MDALLELLNTVSFSQALIFTNFALTAESMCLEATSQGWSAAFIAGTQDQVSRLEAVERLKRFQTRLLFSTDLGARGIDAQHVDLVVNLDVAESPETYLHRIGRAGRFGSNALAVNVLVDEAELEDLRRIVYVTGSKIGLIDGDLDLWQCDKDELELLEPLEVTEEELSSKKVKRRGKKNKKNKKNFEYEECSGEAPNLSEIQWVEVEPRTTAAAKKVQNLNPEETYQRDLDQFRRKLAEIEGEIGDFTSEGENVKDVLKRLESNGFIPMQLEPQEDDEEPDVEDGEFVDDEFSQHLPNPNPNRLIAEGDYSRWFREVKENAEFIRDMELLRLMNEFVIHEKE